MPLKSIYFAGVERFEQCLVNDTEHILPGEVGPHVRDIQIAIGIVDGVTIDEGELLASRYGPSTADAVQEYKKTRDIVNRNYQSSADNIVGKRTIARLDEDMFNLQREPEAGRPRICMREGGGSRLRMPDPAPFPRGGKLDLPFVASRGPQNGRSS